MRMLGTADPSVLLSTEPAFQPALQPLYFFFFSFAVERIEPRALYTLDKFFTSELQPTHFHIPLLLKIGEFLKAFYEYCYLKTCESF